MTEMSPVSNVGRFTDASPGASGRILPNMEMKILDVDGNVRPSPATQFVWTSANVGPGRHFATVSLFGAHAGLYYA